MDISMFKFHLFPSVFFHVALRHWKPASLRPIILASVSSDRSILVFSIEVQGESGLNSSQAW